MTRLREGVQDASDVGLLILRALACGVVISGSLHAPVPWERSSEACELLLPRPRRWRAYLRGGLTQLEVCANGGPTS